MIESLFGAPIADDPASLAAEAGKEDRVMAERAKVQAIQLEAFRRWVAGEPGPDV